MNVTRQQIVDAALAYRGVEYAAGGMSVDPGLNCLGFVACTFRDVGVVSAEEFSQFRGKANFTKDETLEMLLLPWGEKLSDWRDCLPGDVLAIAVESDPHHCGILIRKIIRGEHTDYYIEHASRNNGVEVRRFFGSLLRPIKAAYRVKGIE